MPNLPPYSASMGSWLRCLPMAGLLLVGSADAAEDLVFSLSCDGTVKALRGDGGKAPKVTGQVRFHPGVFGQALEVGETGASLTFLCQGNLPLAKGTVEMWLKQVS